MPRSLGGKNDDHYLQLSAINLSRNLEKSSHPISLKSFYVEDSDSDSSRLDIPRPRSIAGDYPVDSHGKTCVPNSYGVIDTGKRFRKKIKKIANAEERTINESIKSDEMFETARGYPLAHSRTKNGLSQLVESTLDIQNKSMRGMSLAVMTKQLKAARMKLFAARTAIDVQPKLIQKLNSGNDVNAVRRKSVLRLNSPILESRSKSKTEKAKIKTIYMSLVGDHEAKAWLTNFNENSIRNPTLLDYFNESFDPVGFQDRISLYVDSVRCDVDKVVTGKFYNNIMLGKRMFGPSKKQMFERSMIGGMERRFEILDNQVNHIPFTHDASDANKELCRNPSIHCRDSTRVVLSYPPGENDFIHANRVAGGPLFSEFIITQAPMENTIGDFWRMVWQEKVPYIFMLISRKDSSRCAHYWPKSQNSAPMEFYGLVVQNMGVNTSANPLFRITSILISGPNGEQHRLEHWQGNMNNSSNIISPINILRIARNCSRPVIIHDHYGISRAACIVAIEIAICSLIKGPSYKHLVQQSVHFLRSKRSFSVETPMQFIFIHRCVQYMFRNIGLNIRGMDCDYHKWLKQRASRMFIDDLEAPIPGYRLLSPKIDPDLLRQVRRPARPNYRREAPDCVGEWPLPLHENNRSLI